MRREGGGGGVPRGIRRILMYCSVSVLYCNVGRMQATQRGADPTRPDPKVCELKRQETALAGFFRPGGSGGDSGA